MNLQFIHDTKGNTTGVFIPIEEWQGLKSKYSDLQNEEILSETDLHSWQKEIIDVRLKDYDADPNGVIAFETTLSDIRKSL